MAWPVLVFDIESIPDIAGLRQLRDDPADWSDAQVYEAWLAERKAKGQNDFAPLHLQRVLVISVVFRNADGSILFRPEVDAALFASTCAIAIAIGTLAAALPARRAARMDPVTAIRNG